MTDETTHIARQAGALDEASQWRRSEAELRLLPCPFCGNDGSGPIEDALHIAFNVYDFRDPSWSVQCDKCTANMGYSDSEDEVVEAWNRRADLARPSLAGDEMVAQALKRAERKLSAYVGVCKGDKELTETVLPMVRAALSAMNTPAQGGKT